MGAIGIRKAAVGTAPVAREELLTVLFVAMFFSLLLIVGLAAVVYIHVKDRNTPLPPRPDGKTRWVVITGCDTGFGRMCATQLSKQKGYGVLAGCLTEAAVKDYQKMKGNLHPFVLDVTKDADIKNLRLLARQKCPNGVWAVINNAGLGFGTITDWTPISDVRKMFDVNFFGIYSVNDALSESIHMAKGRIVNVASIAGRLASKGLGAYSASKFAVEALSDSMRRELRLKGVTVHLIEPGFHATEIVKKERVIAMHTGYWNGLSEERKAFYDKSEADYLLKLATEVVNPADPQPVIDAMIHAVTGLKPRRRYVIGLDGYLAIFLSAIPACMSDNLMPFVEWLLGKVRLQ